MSQILALITKHQILRFAIVGGFGAVLHASIVMILHAGLKVQLLLSTCIGFCTVATINYFLHYMWTFKSEKEHHRAFFQFAAVTCFGFCLNLGVVDLGGKVLQFNYLLVQFVAIAIVATSNYLFGALWVFQKRWAIAPPV